MWVLGRMLTVSLARRVTGDMTTRGGTEGPEQQGKLRQPAQITVQTVSLSITTCCFVAKRREVEAGR